MDNAYIPMGNAHIPMDNVYTYCSIHKNEPDDMLGSSGCFKKEAATYSPTFYRSTIGATGLNFSVRDGKRWDPGAITT